MEKDNDNDETQKTKQIKMFPVLTNCGRRKIILILTSKATAAF